MPCGTPIEIIRKYMETRGNDEQGVRAPDISERGAGSPDEQDFRLLPFRLEPDADGQEDLVPDHE
jgi:hypothetical protein